MILSLYARREVGVVGNMAVRPYGRGQVGRVAMDQEV